jgi:hypothetical protein
MGRETNVIGCYETYVYRGVSNEQEGGSELQREITIRKVNWPPGLID